MKPSPGHCSILSVCNISKLESLFPYFDENPLLKNLGFHHIAINQPYGTIDLPSAAESVIHLEWEYYQ